MTDEKLSQMLQQALSSDIPGEQLNRNIKSKMEEMGMKKHFSVKRALIMAAVCCLLVGTVSVASSGVVSYIVSSSGLHVYTDFEQLEQAEKKAGFRVKAKEKFANGYSFKSVDVTESKDMDQSDNVIAKYQEILFTYEKGTDDIYINVMQSGNIHGDGTRVPDRKVELEGIEVEYYIDTYKWVPTDYELTAEDEVNLLRDDYFISDGADEVSETKVCHVNWYQDDIYYSIMAYQEMPAEVLFAMAEELIISEN
ncbi:MAG: hypothetical protein J6J79_09505 [Lachnospiraceae bacterium]|nr:hypothetical protein [Lachnospiraceae bacterium]